MKRYILILFLAGLIACNDDNTVNPISDGEIYFPPIVGDLWDTTSFEELNWNRSAANDLYEFLSQHGTRGFIVLKDGKIVIEKYWGNNILDTAPFDKSSAWYWASAGKTLTAVLVGLAQERGLLNINNKTSDYLGENWSSMSLDKENLILIKHQLTMTTGLDYGVSNPDCTDPDCLQYKSDAGSQWFYHNAPYTLLERVVSNSAGQTYNEFTDDAIESQIGMNGSWIQLGDNNVYWSTAQDAARFGLLLLNQGKWADNQIITDNNYYNAMINSSQDMNPSYGYLTWLNGKSSIILPGLTIGFNTPLANDAPSDLFAAIGKNGQFIDVVPSKKLVVIRMGEAPDNALVPIVFHNDMWLKLNAVID